MQWNTKGVIIIWASEWMNLFQQSVQYHIITYKQQFTIEKKKQKTFCTSIVVALEILTRFDYVHFYIAIGLKYF